MTTVNTPLPQCSSTLHEVGIEFVETTDRIGGKGPFQAKPYVQPVLVSNDRYQQIINSNDREDRSTFGRQPEIYDDQLDSWMNRFQYSEDTSWKNQMNVWAAEFKRLSNNAAASNGILSLIHDLKSATDYAFSIAEDGTSKHGCMYDFYSDYYSTSLYRVIESAASLQAAVNALSGDDCNATEAKLAAHITLEYARQKLRNILPYPNEDMVIVKNSTTHYILDQSQEIKNALATIKKDERAQQMTGGDFWNQITTDYDHQQFAKLILFAYPDEKARVQYLQSIKVNVVTMKQRPDGTSEDPQEYVSQFSPDRAYGLRDYVGGY